MTSASTSSQSPDFAMSTMINDPRTASANCRFVAWSNGLLISLAFYTSCVTLALPQAGVLESASLDWSMMLR